MSPCTTIGVYSDMESAHPKLKWMVQTENITESMQSGLVPILPAMMPESVVEVYTSCLEAIAKPGLTAADVLEQLRQIQKDHGNAGGAAASQVGGGQLVHYIVFEGGVTVISAHTIPGGSGNAWLQLLTLVFTQVANGSLKASSTAPNCTCILLSNRPVAWQRNLTACHKLTAPYTLYYVVFIRPRRVSVNHFQTCH